MNILITGAAGFVGTHLVEHYSKQRQGESLHCLVFGSHGDLPRYIPQDRLYEIDLREYQKVADLFTTIKPDQIIHLAALAAVGESFKHPQRVLENNILVATNVLEAARLKAKQATILLVGSADEYGQVRPEEVPISEVAPLRPTSPYAVSKVAVDFLGLQYSLAHGLRIVRVRPFNHIGEYQQEGFAVPDFARQIVEAELGKKDVIQVGNLSAVRDFTDAKDIALAYELALRKCLPGEVYNIGSGKGVRMQDLLNLMIARATRPIRVEVDARRYRPIDVEAVVADSTKFRELTGWRPRIPLEATLERVLHYWRKKLHHQD